MRRMDELALTEELIAYDTSNAGGHQALRRVRQGLARGERHRGRARSSPRAAGDDRRGRARRTRADAAAARPHRRRARAAASSSSPARRRPPLRARRLRHEGRAGRLMLAPRRPARPGARCGSALGSSRTRSPRRRTTAAATRLVESGFVGDFAITGEPTDIHVGRGRRRACWRCGSQVQRARGARRDAVAGRERDSVGDRGVPGYRVATVCTPQLRAVRPALDQPRPDPGRRRPEQGPRHLRHRRRRPLSCPSRIPTRSSPRSRGLPDTARARHLPAPAGGGRPGLPVRAGPLRGGLAAPPRAGDERRAATAPPTPSRSWRRAFRRSSSARSATATTARRVGLDQLAAQLPAGARGLRQGFPGMAAA